MSLLVLILILAVVGVALYFFNTMVTTIDPKFKWLINAVVIIAALIYVLQAFGVVDLLNRANVPRVH